MSEKLNKIGLISMTENIIDDADKIQQSSEPGELSYELAGDLLVLGLVVREILRRSDIK